ncbi:MAG: hypothetical protein LLG40_15605 [Deltaproteobacteria bacterium]|nr:hypothetical protein [Deltaproteobacteria bacterium]
MKMIFNQPICTRCACHHNDLNYPNNCAITTDVESCGIAEIKYPRRIQRALAWIDNHWLAIALISAILSLIIFWSLWVFNAGNSAAIESLRIRQDAEFKKMERQITPAEWERRYKKHGVQTVIFEPGKEPYFRDAKGRKCRFV